MPITWAAAVWHPCGSSVPRRNPGPARAPRSAAEHVFLTPLPPGPAPFFDSLTKLPCHEFFYVAPSQLHGSRGRPRAEQALSCKFVRRDGA